MAYKKNTKVAPVQPEENTTPDTTQGTVTPETMEMLQQMQQMQENEQMMQQQVNNAQHDEKFANQEQTEPVITEKEIDAAMETLKKYQKCKQNLENRIVENEEWFKMQHWELLRKDKDATEVEPASAWLFNTIINKHADAMDNYPEASILPREKSDEQTASVLSSVLPVIMEQNDYEETYSNNWWYKLKTGTALTGVFWDNNKLNGLGDVSVQKCDILNLFWESGITDIQKSQNVFYVTMMDNDVLKTMYPELKKLGARPEIDTAKYIYDDQVDTTEKSAVIDWYYKKTIKTESTQGVPQTRTVLHYCKFCNGTVLYASENDENYRDRGWYDHGMYPFVVDTMFPEEGMLCGFGYIDAMKDCQGYVDKMQQAILDNALANARGKWALREDSGINEEEFVDPRKTIVKFNGNLGEDAFRQITPNPIPATYVNIMNYKIEELKDTTGNTAASQGQSSSVTSASGIASLQEAAGKLARDSNKSSYRAFKKVCYMVIELIRQFYDEPRCYRITGNDGTYDYQQMSNQNLKPVPQGQAFGIDLGERLPVFDIEVKASKQSAYSRESQNQMALNFYNLGFFAPTNADATLACLEMMDFDGKDRVISRVKQNMTLFNQVQMLQQQMMQMGMIIDAQNGTNLSGQMVTQAQATQEQQEKTGEKKEGTINQSKGSLSSQAASAARNASKPN